MADTYTIVSVIPTEELVAGTQIRKVIEASGLTIPHSVTFTVVVPREGDWRAALAKAAAAEAAELEAAFDL